MSALRTWLLARLLRPELLRVVQTLEAPDRFQPDPEITPAEQAAWGNLLASPVLLKVDVAMINLCQQQAQRAILATPDRLPFEAGVAWGMRTAWQLAKSISTMSGAEAGKSENQPTATDGAGLDHLNP